MSSKPSGYDDGGPGVDSEELIKELLQKSGWGVKELRKAADGGRAPMLEATVSDDVRIPDFQIHHHDHSPRYVEVKSFGSSIKFGVAEEERHGFEDRKYEDYIEFQKLADNPVYIFIHERQEGVVLRQKIKHLRPVQVLTDKDVLQRSYNRQHAMAFFKRSDFELVTNCLGQYSTAFAQDGLIEEDIELSPFGLSGEDGGQATLGGDF